ncbi:hypothetical protein NQZ68_025730 [Dissostichus eleginoides]|nr:hypothetical protein NQZ68_025730 [Dissostichus eleginoides]
MQKSLALSPSSRLSQAAVSDSAATLPWLSSTNAGAGALPEPKPPPLWEPWSLVLSFHQSWSRLTRLLSGLVQTQGPSSDFHTQQIDPTTRCVLPGPRWSVAAGSAQLQLHHGLAWRCRTVLQLYPIRLRLTHRMLPWSRHRPDLEATPSRASFSPPPPAQRIH